MEKNNSITKLEISQQQMLMNIIDRFNAILFHDQFDVPYAQIKQKNKLKIFPLNSKKLRGLISYEFYKMVGKAPIKDNINNTIDTLIGRALFEGEKIELHNRIAWHKNELYYDIGNWTAIKINQDGWNLITDDLPILFRKYNHQKIQVTPVQVSAEDVSSIFKNRLRTFINLSEKEYLLFTIQLITCFIPNIPRAIGNSEGAAGSGKSTLGRILKKTVDPSHIEIQNPPNNQTEFCQIADHNYVVVLDNLRNIKPWLSDNICSAVTGSGISKRRLYSDDEDIIFNYQRVFFLTGISRVGNSPDLLDRSILYHLQRINNSDRKTEKIFWEEFEQLLPELLGSIFNVISGAISIYKDMELDHYPRLADFAIWGEAVSRALGNKPYHFLEAYYENIDIQHQEVVDTNPIAKIIMHFMDEREEWESTPTELFENFEEIAFEIGVNVRKEPLFPKSVSKLWHRIQEVEHNLRELGIEVSRSKSGDRKIIIKKTTDHAVHAVLSQSAEDEYNESLDSLDGTDSTFDIFDIDGISEFEWDNQ